MSLFGRSLQSFRAIFLRGALSRPARFYHAVFRLTKPALLLLALGGCATSSEWGLRVENVPPLKLDGQFYTFTQAQQSTTDPGVLALSDEMREFVAGITAQSNNPRNTLMSLHWAVKSPSGLNMQYDPWAEGTAQDAFERGTANCLSYAHMFIALAREAGLPARYQWMEVRPQWHRLGERVAVRLHVNVQVRLRDTTEYMIDIDPLTRSQLAGARLMSDEEGLALYHNNLAMQALADEHPVEAWKMLLRGLSVAPGMSQLWVNLGAIYRHAGQYAEAEQAYFHALEVDHSDRSAMNNLAVLYELQGRVREQDYWLDRMSRYRDRNPYYHVGLGDLAMEAQQWEDARNHYARAYQLQPEDEEIIYALGLAEHQRGNRKKAMKLIAKAMEQASFRVDKARYRMQLEAIREERAAAL